MRVQTDNGEVNNGVMNGHKLASTRIEVENGPPEKLGIEDISAFDPIT